MRFQVEVRPRSAADRTFVAFYLIEAATEQTALEEANATVPGPKPGQGRGRPQVPTCQVAAHGPAALMARCAQHIRDSGARVVRSGPNKASLGRALAFAPAGNRAGGLFRQSVVGLTKPAFQPYTRTTRRSRRPLRLEQKGPRAAGLIGSTECSYFLRRLQPRPARPRPRRATEAGAGTSSRSMEKNWARVKASPL